MAGFLNLDIAGRVSELETLLRQVLPRNIMWRVVLGRGLEFDGFRDYGFSDDASNIDWKASVRSNRMLVKKYIEERDRKFMFFIDVGENMIFGSTEKLKCEFAAEMSCALAHLILTGGDRVGFVLYNDKVVKSKNPSLGFSVFDVMSYELGESSNYGGISNLRNILDIYLQTLSDDLSLVFLISDFINFDKSYREKLESLSNRFETIAIILRDPLDKKLPSINKEVIIEDPKSGQKLLINPRVSKNIYETNALRQLKFVKSTFKDLGIDFLEISTEDLFAEKIAQFLRERVEGGRFTKNVS